MTIDKLHEMSAETLNTELLALRRQQFNLRIKKATGQLSTTHDLRSVRRNIARIKMKLAEKAGMRDE